MMPWVIYTYHNPSLTSRGLTNQIIILRAAIESLYRKGTPCALAIGAFYDDVNDQTQTQSFFNILDMTKLQSRYSPIVTFMDLHPSYTGYFFIGKDMSMECDGDGGGSLESIITTQRHCHNGPVTITNGDGDRTHAPMRYDWTGVQVRGAPTRDWDMDSEDCREFTRDLVFRIKHTPAIQDPRITALKPSSSSSGVVHMLHLRNEPDGLQWWSARNRMSTRNFDLHLTKQYVRMVKEYIPTRDILLVLTARTTSNPVLDILEELGYTMVMCKKTFAGRELAAIEDLDFAQKHTNGMFLGCRKGSTFSACMLRYRVQYRGEVHLDLDRIRDPPRHFPKLEFK